MSTIPPGFLTPAAKEINVDPGFFLPNLEEHYAKANEFYKSIGSPKYVCAPMVHQSDLPFRMFVRKYGCTLCYTPMINALSVTSNPKRLPQYFGTAPEDRPLFAQLAGDSVTTMVNAGKLLQDHVDAIDINLGCPQQIAKRGHYGSFILEETQLIQSLVRNLHDQLKVPITVKMRVLVNDPTGERTLALGRALQDSGASILTLHGRTREMLKLKLGPNDFDMVKRMKETLRIPVFSNGGIESMTDVKFALDYTGVDGVMVSEALLTWPTMFAYEKHDDEPDTIDQSLELLDYFDKYPGWKQVIRPHLFKILFKELTTHTDIRTLLSAPKLGSDLRPVLRMLQRKQIALYEKYKADPENFDFEKERYDADFEARMYDKLQAERELEEAKAREEDPSLQQVAKHSGVALIGTAEANMSKVSKPPIDWKPPNGPNKGESIVRKYTKKEVMQLEDDGVPVTVPKEAYPFLKQFYSHQKPWYLRYFGRLKTAEELGWHALSPCTAPATLSSTSSDTEQVEQEPAAKKQKVEESQPQEHEHKKEVL